MNKFNTLITSINNDVITTKIKLIINDTSSNLFNFIKPVSNELIIYTYGIVLIICLGLIVWIKIEGNKRKNNKNSSN